MHNADRWLPKNCLAEFDPASAIISCGSRTPYDYLFSKKISRQIWPVRFARYAVALRLLKPPWGNFMNLKSTLIVSATLLFVSAPAWADSMKTTASSPASPRTSSFGRADLKRLGGFKTKDSRLVDVEPDGDADDASAMSTPEPRSLGLLFTGLLCIGALAGAVACPRNQFVATA